MGSAIHGLLIIGLLAACCAVPVTQANFQFFSTYDIQQVDSLCRGDGSYLAWGAGKRKVLLYHRDGYIPDLHYQLPDAIRADNLLSTAAVLCLDDVTQDLETCEYSIFFSVPRERQTFTVAVHPLSGDPEIRLHGSIKGALPADCGDLDTVDSSVTRLTGPAPGPEAVIDFLDANLLNWLDEDRDGLRNLEEFVLASDPLDADSPPPGIAVHLNRDSALRIREGEFFTLIVDLIPASLLGNPADYFFWADTPAGQRVYQLPAGYEDTDVLTPTVSAPLIKLLNFPVFPPRDMPPGEYRFNFKVVDDQGNEMASHADLTVVPDNCRNVTDLPLSISANWEHGCFSGPDNSSGDPARYYTFSVREMTQLKLTLESGANDAELVLHWGPGRSGFILSRSLEFDGVEYLQERVFAGTYTLEVLLRDGTDAFPGFTLASDSSGIPWYFNEVSVTAGIDYVHGYAEMETGEAYERQLMGAGVAAGDYDLDGWVDLYVTAGSAGSNRLYRNLGDGTFIETGLSAGVARQGAKDSGAVFADIDGDGWPDLFVGGLNGTPPVVYRNRQNGTFADVTAVTGLAGLENTFSGSFGDYDLDGDLDLYVTHWNDSYGGNYLLRNEGDFVFRDVSSEAGIPDGLMADYTTNFADINNDGWPDLLVAADFNTSQVFINDRNGTFRNTTTGVISDDNGMGAAVGDYDNDGDMDWFVSSIFDPNGLPEDVIPGVHTGTTGNRLYRNLGNGSFEDVTDFAGVRYGAWGWGSCFADFNNDGFLDLFHVNGFVTNNFLSSRAFLDDASRLYISNQDGSFEEMSYALNLVDRGQGRGIVCFDYDRDGDVDLFVANNQQAPALYRNEGGNNGNYLHLTVDGENRNAMGIGARIELTAGNLTQVREIRAGNNYISSNPPEAYFGLGSHESIDRIRITWPSGAEKVLTNVKANQLLHISQ